MQKGMTLLAVILGIVLLVGPLSDIRAFATDDKGNGNNNDNFTMSVLVHNADKFVCGQDANVSAA